MEQRGHSEVIRAKVPMAEVLRYASDLTSMTSGRGSFDISFSHYEPVPEQLTAKTRRRAEEEGRGVGRPVRPADAGTGRDEELSESGEAADPRITQSSGRARAGRGRRRFRRHRHQPALRVPRVLRAPRARGHAAERARPAVRSSLWSLLLIVTLKYLFFVMRADNGGEGGILALMTLVVPPDRRRDARNIPLRDARPVRRDAALRRRHDHAGDLGAQRRRRSRARHAALRARSSCRSRSRC